MCFLKQHSNFTHGEHSVESNDTNVCTCCSKVPAGNVQDTVASHLQSRSVLAGSHSVPFKQCWTTVCSIFLHVCHSCYIVEPL